MWWIPATSVILISAVQRRKFSSMSSYYMCVCNFLLFICLFVYLFICLFVYLFICLFVYLFICLFVYLFICLFVYLFICLICLICLICIHLFIYVLFIFVIIIFSFQINIQFTITIFFLGNTELININDRNFFKFSPTNLFPESDDSVFWV